MLWAPRPVTHTAGENKARAKPANPMTKFISGFIVVQILGPNLLTKGGPPRPGLAPPFDSPHGLSFSPQTVRMRALSRYSKYCIPFATRKSNFELAMGSSQLKMLISPNWISPVFFSSITKIRAMLSQSECLPKLVKEVWWYCLISIGNIYSLFYYLTTALASLAQIEATERQLFAFRASGTAGVCMRV